MPINNMKSRINYYGGSSQVARMNKDKLKNLKKALYHSYQSATAILSDGREFRCLINPNKLSLDIDNKTLSIPFRDYCINSNYTDPDFEDDVHQSEEGTWEDMQDLVAILTYADESWEDMGDPENAIIPDEPFYSGEEQDTNLKEGDIITWKENGSHWLVYLRRLEETAYFRADIRRCRYQLTLGNGSNYWAYVRGPVEQSIIWMQTKGNYFNQLNNTLVMYITQNEETLKYFHRFKRVMINNQPWEVQSVDSLSTPGILEVALKETYNNSIETNIQKVIENVTKDDYVEESSSFETYVSGLTTVYPYDVKTYTLKNYSGKLGTWRVLNESKKNIVKLNPLNDNQVEVQIITGKSGNFTL